MNAYAISLSLTIGDESPPRKSWLSTNVTASSARVSTTVPCSASRRSENPKLSHTP